MTLLRSYKDDVILHVWICQQWKELNLAIRVLLMTKLNITMQQEANVVMSAGPSVCLTWLEDLSHIHIASRSSYVWASRTYIIHLIGSMIFTNKNSTYVYISYVQYLNESTYLPLAHLGSSCIGIPVTSHFS